MCTFNLSTSYVLISEFVESKSVLRANELKTAAETANYALHCH
jgi:hypothetical protein